MVNEKRDLIDRKDLAETLSTLTMTIAGLRAGKGVLDEFMKEYRKSVLRIVDETPTVDAVEVVHGRWVHDQVEVCSPFVDSLPIWVDVMQCSVCKEYIEGSYGTNYCPNCGAKMDGDVYV